MNAPTTPPDDDALGRLIARAPPRRTPPDHVERLVRRNVEAAWQAQLAERKARRPSRTRGTWVATAASLVAVVSIGLVVLRGGARIDAPLGAYVMPLGTLTVLDHEGDPRTLTRAAGGTPVLPEDRVRTAADGGLRIQLATGPGLRVAANTELRWLGADRVELVKGAVFVDSGARLDESAPLAIETRHGVVSHLGTRYLVRVTDTAVDVRVREGRVTVDAAGRKMIAGSGELIVVSRGRPPVKGSDAGHGEAWQWIEQLADPFPIENHTLAEFFDWVASETGVSVRYASGTEEVARRTVLHGRPQVATPREALATVIQTSDLQATLVDGELRVSYR